jgi:hypothetical protein
MKIKNLDCNILDMLGDECARSGATGPFEIERVYRTFSDIPVENVSSAIQKLIQRALMTIENNGQSLHLTRAGIEEVEALKNCLNS